MWPLREKCPNMGFLLVRIFLYSDQKKLRIWTLLTWILKSRYLNWETYYKKKTLNHWQCHCQFFIFLKFFWRALALLKVRWKNDKRKSFYQRCFLIQYCTELKKCSICETTLTFLLNLIINNERWKKVKCPWDSAFKLYWIMCQNIAYFFTCKNHLKISPKFCFWSLFIGKF